MTSVARRYGSQDGAFSRPPVHENDEGTAPVILMVSGGADSTALLVLAATSALDIEDGRGCARIARERLHVLHVNHQLRGVDAEEDEEFVRELAARYGVPCTVESADVEALAKQRGDNVENIGREVRYAAATRLANELAAQMGCPRSAARILTAHTANDRAETFLMNAVRGAGASGLSSIPRRRNRIVRPLLDKTHEELCDLLRMRGIVWREDATNADTHYLRAFVRHEVLPVVERKNPRVVGSIASTCDILSDEDSYLTQVASRAFRELERHTSEGIVALDAARLAALDVAIARRVVRFAILRACPDCRLEARHINGVLQLVAAGTGSMTVPLGVDCRVVHGVLFLRARAEEEHLEAGWLEVPGEFELGDGRVLTARLIPLAAGQNAEELARFHGREWENTSVLLDAQLCEVGEKSGRLWVDGPTSGEVLCPLGMHGQSKRLSALLADAHVPAAERSSVPVVRTGPSGKVLWVAGIRADERAKCGPATKVLLELGIRAGV